MSRKIDPVIHRRRLSAELRRIRESKSLTQRSVADAMDWSHSKIIRIEAGSVGVTPSDVRSLLGYYEVADEQRVALLDVARAARQPSIWSPYSDLVSPEFFFYLGHESSASSIRGFQPLIVPGLFQTPDYARAVLRTFARIQDDEKIEALVDLRIARQEILEGDDRPEISFLLDEGVIRRVVGSPRVMREQLEHLRQVSATDRITILVVPYGIGLHRLMLWSSALLEFDDGPDTRMLHLELPEGDKLIREDDLDANARPLGLPHSYLEEFFTLEGYALDQSLNELITGSLALLEGER